MLTRGKYIRAKVFCSQNSILSQTGRVITPIFHPMGIEQDNWPATVGLITGTLAKEVVVGTMNTLYSQNQKLIKTDQAFNLSQGLGFAVKDTYNSLTNISGRSLANPFTANEADHDMSRTAIGAMIHSFGGPISAFAYMLFVLLYVPCVSTIAVTQRETSSKAWTWLSVLWSFSIAYGIAVLFYQLATIIQHPASSISWIVGILVYLGGLIAAMLYISRRQQLPDEGMILRHRPSLSTKKSGKVGCGCK
ncbi:MAG: nucleoside recognition domain-containing protein [Pseudomonadota bacterium]